MPAGATGTRRSVAGLDPLVEGEGFVVTEGRMLVGIRGVGQRTHEQFGIAEAMAETLFELGHARRVQRDDARPDTS